MKLIKLILEIYTHDILIGFVLPSMKSTSIDDIAPQIV